MKYGIAHNQKSSSAVWNSHLGLIMILKDIYLSGTLSSPVIVFDKPNLKTFILINLNLKVMHKNNNAFKRTNHLFHVPIDQLKTSLSLPIFISSSFQIH